jgi:catechol 1,2-dioxygenase
VIVSAAAHVPLVTQLYIDSSDYLDNDVADAVKDALIVHPRPQEGSDELTFTYDFALEREMATAPA